MFFALVLISCYNLTLNLIILAFKCSHYNNNNIENIKTAELCADFKIFITFFTYSQEQAAYFIPIYHKTIVETDWFFSIKLTLRYTNFPSSSELSDHSLKQTSVSENLP